MKQQPFVISYARYSSLAQREGTSLERQAAYAQEWADANGMTLNKTLRDQGISAFKGKHAEKGELGGFLRDIEDGKIPRGSVLVVEGLDRLSRQAPMEAMAQFSAIIRRGITIVTAKDERVFNEAELKREPMGLLMSLIVMVRANEESETKADRVRKAIRLRSEAWQAGDRSERNRLGGRFPSWLRKSSNGGFELDPERAHATRTAVDLYLSGYGMVGVAEKLTELGLMLTERGSMVAQVERLLRNSALIGENVVDVAADDKHPAKSFRLEGYFPALLKVSKWLELQDAVKSRSVPTYSNKGTIPHVLTGFGATTCGYCGAAVVSQVYTNAKRDEAGLIRDTYRRLRCSHYMKAGLECRVGIHSIAAAPLERAVMEFCSELLNLRSLHGGDGDTAARAALEAAQEREAEIVQQLKQISQAIKLSKAATKMVTLVGMMDELEAEKVKAGAEVEAAQRALARVSRSDLNGIEAKFRKLTKGVMNQEPEARLQARQLIIDTFEAIKIYSKGIRPGLPHEGTCHLVLRARGGAERIIEIDASGNWEWISDTLLVAGKAPAAKPAKRLRKTTTA